MLDTEMKDQLKSVFSQLEQPISLVYKPSGHADQDSLLKMLQDIESTSDKITVSPRTLVGQVGGSETQIGGSENVNETNTPPAFSIECSDKPTGISFRGIPTGHEFTSLILAILNSDGKGKFPSDGIVARIKRIKGPIEIKTYISLTCENCPDVVQALNQMAIVHGQFKHEMVDGAYVQDEIEALGIQGVPSIVVNGKMIHSGRIQFLDLIAKLEETFGTNEASGVPRSQDLGQYDVAVIGGGPAGVSAAIYSVRKGLRTALIAEKFGGQVQETKGIENLVSVPYIEGPDLAAQMNEHATSYPIDILDHRRVSRIDSLSGLQIHFEGGDFLKATSVIVATGAKWRELSVPGEKEYLGRGVAYCPHCDGPYYKGKKIAVVGGGNSGVEAAIDLAGIVREVILIEFGDQLRADKVLVDKLKSLPNTSIVTNARTKEVVGNGQKVDGLVYENRLDQSDVRIDLDGIFVQIGLLPNSQFLKGTVETNKMGEIIVDGKGRTSVQGIYAAGDVTTIPYKQIIIAMGDGAKVALAAFEDRMYAAGENHK
jgi:alkyl hydroperoxide reductase subunit F